MNSRPTIATVKRLFAASAGRCAFPGCNVNLVPGGGGTLAEVAHIQSAASGGPRHDPSKFDPDRNEFDNLILLCPTHHALVDARPDRFGTDELAEMKRTHEERVRQLLKQAPVSTDLEDTAATQVARQVDPAGADFAIITALESELAAVLRHFPSLKKVVVGDDSRTYYRGIVLADDEVTPYRVVVTVLASMGNVQSAVATAEVIRHWSPRYIVMCGIAGGLRKRHQQLGDIVIGTSVIYYELAKVRPQASEVRPISYPADTLLLDRALHMHHGTAWRSRLESRPDGAPASASFPAVHFGPIASGEKVVASTAEVKKLIDLHPKMCAVEMEAGGVATTAFAAAHRVGFFVVRSICDFADSKKSDSWQRFAADAAASFLHALIRSRPVAPSEGEWQPIQTQRRTQRSSHDSTWLRTTFFPKLCSSLSMDDLKDYCFLLHVDIDDLAGDTKRAKIRELLLRAERRGRIQEIVDAYEQLSEEDW
jgi:nucleoside phosphorylase